MLLNLLKKIGAWFHKYESRLMPASLIFGFIVDYFTLNKVDSVFDNAILLGHLTITATAIALIYSTHSLSPKKWYQFISPVLPVLMQFSLGGLFSGLIVFYSRSGSFFASLPFIATLLVLLIGNEFVHKKFPRFTFQVSLWYIALFSYLALITPVVLRSINELTFVLAGIISLLIIYLYLKVIGFVIPKNFSVKKVPLFGSIISIYLLFNIFYFANIIPPIPLALKSGTVAHSVTRSDTGSYNVKTEVREWYDIMGFYRTTFHRTASEPVYIFSSVFAPTKFNETVFHDWSLYNKNTNRWVRKSRIPIQIYGGREEGFRGYSFKENMEPGLWRVDIETKRGQVIGRIKFTVENTKKQVELKSEIY